MPNTPHSRGGSVRLQSLRDAYCRISLATSELVQASPEALEQAETELRAAVVLLTEATLATPGPDPELLAAAGDFRRQLNTASRLLHQAASVRFALAAQLYGAAESYTASGRTTLAIQPESATMVARG